MLAMIVYVLKIHTFKTQIAFAIKVIILALNFKDAFNVMINLLQS